MFEGNYIMENSSEYKQFLSFINASTREKMDGYKLNIFENIYEWERDEFIKKLYIIE